MASADERELIRLGELCERGHKFDHATIAYHRAAQLYEAKEQRQKVVAMRRRIAQLLPHDPETRIDLARSLSFIGRNAEAASELEAAAALVETTAPQRAAELLRHVVELDRTRISAMTRLRELTRPLHRPEPEVIIDLPIEAIVDDARTVEYSASHLALLSDCALESGEISLEIDTLS